MYFTLIINLAFFTVLYSCKDIRNPAFGCNCFLNTVLILSVDTAKMEYSICRVYHASFYAVHGKFIIKVVSLSAPSIQRKKQVSFIPSHVLQFPCPLIYITCMKCAAIETINENLCILIHKLPCVVVYTKCYQY